MGKLQPELEPTASESVELEPMILVPLVDKMDEAYSPGCSCGARNGIGSGGSCRCGSLNGGGG
jgi:hypothetical protein